MGMIKQLVGGLMFLYAFVYSAQAIGFRFYADTYDPQVIWDVMNYCTGVGILIAIAVTYFGWRKRANADPLPRLVSQLSLFATLALALVYFPNWFSLIMENEQDAWVSVGWLLVSFMNPLVQATAGLSLLRSGSDD